MDLVAYYSARAPEYDEIYSRPERQDDLATVQALLRARLKSLDVLEVACGTGYWTEKIARVVSSVTALDINESVLQIARERNLPPEKVRFARGDAYALPKFGRSFTAGLAAFWWSHIPRDRRNEFLTGFVQRLERDAPIVLLDNCFVPGNSTPISRTDADGNTYQVRKLRDGTKTEVLKNFPSAEDLARDLAPFGHSLEFHQFTYYWCAVFRTGPFPPGVTRRSPGAQSKSPPRAPLPPER